MFGTPSPDDVRRRLFADGMAAYLAGRYAEAVQRLGDWIGATPARPAEIQDAVARQAAAALSRVGALAGAGSAEAAEATRLVERLRARAPAGAQAAARDPSAIGSGRVRK